MAQDKQYTPEADDWAIGIDATPFLSYFGNFIGGNDGNTAPSWNFLTNNQTITGKYFTSADMAYRGSLRLGFGSNSANSMVGQDGAAAPTYPNLPTMVEDTWKQGNTNIGLSGGLEWRKGNGRLQGFYGGELGIMFSSTSTTYTYGNAMTTTGATSTDFGTGNLNGDPVYGNGRLLSQSGGGTFGLGIRGFIGAEYFVLPKLSIGGEFGWGIAFMSTGAMTETWESTDGSAIGTIEHTGTKSSAFGIDTESNNGVFGTAGSIRMTFHF
eukprot:CAMPEP_0185589236 /NCGR_PEP_ID=MMETSP0434-20130131/56121_1 /TAXON_ID=626734 ORGANISM="Favella taraikaensis, Strain Fe Narragansett Bay" /NCGR_SAMPLE_ID=MMETSP0434 /ASSEMBLY_ACC=CAM_ASM_000379 /LENGTH=267 /DNA_ID=CAMNT_0028212453 /DNA_START=83 /DNA_END=886 /DNA_ORIENTATION=+